MGWSIFQTEVENTLKIWHKPDNYINLSEWYPDLRSWKKQGIINLELQKEARVQGIQVNSAWQDSLIPLGKMTTSGKQSLVMAAIKIIKLFLLIL